MSGNPAAGLLLLLLGVYLLFAFLTGQLEWLFRLGDAIGAARGGTAAVGPASPGPSAPSSTPDPVRVS